MTSTLYDCGDVLAAVPDEDIRAAADFGLQFRVMFKGVQLFHDDDDVDSVLTIRSLEVGFSSVA